MSAWRPGRRRSSGPTVPAGPGSPAQPSSPTGPSSSAGDGPAAPQPELTIDALGRKCPIPIIMLAERIREVPVGAVIAVLADDPAAQTDIPAWCGMKSQQFVVEQPLDRGWSFLIRRAY